MKAARHLCVALAVCAVAFACDSPTGPARPVPPHILFDRSDAEESEPDEWPSALEQQLRAERARINQEAERSKAVYDALKAEWDKAERESDYEITPSGILHCEPLEYAAHVKIVGPEGADLPIGRHRLRIPPGALKEYTVITGEMPVALWVGVRLSPEGLTFAEQPRLTLSYKHCNLPTAHRGRVAYTDEALNILEYPTSRKRGKAQVEAWLRHFSNYAVAW
jgi:hypothetical protein